MIVTSWPLEAWHPEQLGVAGIGVPRKGLHRSTRPAGCCITLPGNGAMVILECGLCAMAAQHKETERERQRIAQS